MCAACAVQARSVGDEQLVEGLRASCRVMEIQISIAKQLQQRIQQAASANQGQQGGGPQGGASTSGDGRGGNDGGGAEVDALRAQLRELVSDCKDISELYNTYAQPLQMWGSCLEICDFAGQVPPEYVRQLWDLYLKQSVDESGGGGAGGPDARLEEACSRVQALGSKFYPNESRCVIRLGGLSSDL